MAENTFLSIEKATRIRSKANLDNGECDIENQRKNSDDNGTAPASENEYEIELASNFFNKREKSIATRNKSYIIENIEDVKDDFIIKIGDNVKEQNIIQNEVNENNEDVMDFTDLKVPSIMSKEEEKKSLILIKKKNIRIIVIRGYRNEYNDRIYSYEEGRRLLIIPTDITLQKLKEECENILKKSVFELYVIENITIKRLLNTRYLYNLDELIATTESPEAIYKNKFCFKLARTLNLGYPEHKCFMESNELRANSQRFLSKANVANVVQRLNITAPVVEQGNQEIRKMSKGWDKVANKLLNKKERPFFVYPWKESIKVDFNLMKWMIGCPLSIGIILACLPFDRDLELKNNASDHKLYMYIGMMILGFSTGIFVNAWIGFYFYIHMSWMSYIIGGLATGLLGIGSYYGLNSLYFPFYNTPISSMLLLTAIVYVLAYPHIPYRLRKLKSSRKEMVNSLIIMDFFILVFVVNRMLVLNVGQRDALSLLTLSVMYPLLVSRSTADCARLAETFNRKSVAIVEAFFTFVSSVFQMIVFLGINSDVSPLLVFSLINTTDLFCVAIDGPFLALLSKKNRLLVNKHRTTVDENPYDEGLGMFIKWLRDPLKLKPLLIKCYCEASAKITFLILVFLMRYGPSNGGYPFVSDVHHELFYDTVIFTSCELCLWITVAYSVEYYLRFKRCQYMLHKEKQNMLSIAKILGLTNMFITVLLLLQQAPASGA